MKGKEKQRLNRKKKDFSYRNYCVYKKSLTWKIELLVVMNANSGEQVT